MRTHARRLARPPMNPIARFKAWRRARLILRFAFADEAWEATLARYRFFARLGADERRRLRELVSLFCADKEFVGAGGFEITLTTKLSIAAQACLPILELDLSFYDGWHGIVVYSGEVVARRTVQDDDGVVHEYDEVISGEAMPGGPVVLSWDDVALAGYGGAPAYNVVIHEFAHKIDMLKGAATGVPPLSPVLHAGLDGRAFAADLKAAYKAFIGQVGQWQDGGARDADAPRIDAYAAQDPAEFFAVLSEAFFTRPRDVATEFPDLYGWFERYYRQKPLG